MTTINPRLRHIGIRVKEINTTHEKFYESLGFKRLDAGGARIHGRYIKWLKMVNGDGTVIELIDGGMPHLAIEVDHVDKNAYYFVTPGGAKTQYIQDASGNCIELVELSKEE